LCHGVLELSHIISRDTKKGVKLSDGEPFEIIRQNEVAKRVTLLRGDNCTSKIRKKSERRARRQEAMLGQPFAQIEEGVAARNFAVIFIAVGDGIERELEPAGALAAGGSGEEVFDAGAHLGDCHALHLDAKPEEGI